MWNRREAWPRIESYMRYHLKTRLWGPYEACPSISCFTQSPLLVSTKLKELRIDARSGSTCAYQSITVITLLSVAFHIWSYTLLFRGCLSFTEFCMTVTSRSIDSYPNTNPVAEKTLDIIRINGTSTPLLSRRHVPRSPHFVY